MRNSAIPSPARIIHCWKFFEPVSDTMCVTSSASRKRRLRLSDRAYSQWRAMLSKPRFARIHLAVGHAPHVRLKLVVTSNCILT